MESNKKTAIVPKETPHFFIWIPKDGKIQESEKVVPVPEVYIKMLCEEATKLQKTKTPCLLVYMSSMFPEASRSEMKKLETEFRKNGFSNVHIVDYDTDMKNDVIKTQAGQLHNKTLEDFKLIYKNSKNQNSTDHNPAIECIGGFVDFFRLLVLEYSDVMLKNINNKSKDILYRDFDMILKGDNMSDIKYDPILPWIADTSKGYIENGLIIKTPCNKKLIHSMLNECCRQDRKRIKDYSKEIEEIKTKYNDFYPKLYSDAYDDIKKLTKDCYEKVSPYKIMVDILFDYEINKLINKIQKDQTIDGENKNSLIYNLQKQQYDQIAIDDIKKYFDNLYSQTEFERIIHAQIRENSGNEVNNIFKDCNHMAWCTNTVPIQYQDWMVVEKIIKDNKIVNRLYLSNNKHQTPPKPQGDISEVPNVINQSQPTTTLSGLMNYNIHEK